MLVHKRHQVVQAENGLVGLQELANNGFDLVISDLAMPIMDGYQMIKKLKSVLTLAVPVILISGLESEEEERLKDKLLAERMIMAFLPKPFDLNTLKNIIKRI